MAAQTDIFFNLNLIDKTTAGAASAQKTIANVGRSYQQVAKNTQMVDKTQRAMFRGMRGQWGQVGHQIQDIAVQLQMGQNAMLVFGQQGSQIASLMGPGGAIVGGVLAVGAAVLSALVPSLMKGSQTTEEFVKQTVALGKALKDATPEELALISERTAKSQEKLKEEVSKAEKELAKLEAKLKRVNQEYEDNKGIQEYTAAFGAASSYAEANRRTAEKLTDQIIDQKSAVLEAKQALQGFNEEQVKLTENAYVESLKEQAAQLGMTKEQIMLTKLMQEDLTDVQRQSGIEAIAQIERYNELTEALKHQEEQQKKAADEMKRVLDGFSKHAEDAFVGIIDGTNSVKDAFKDMARSIVNDLIRMQINRAITQPLNNMLSGVLGGAGAPVSNANWVNPGSVGATTYPLPSRSTGSMTPLPARAVGGQVAANKPYLVGERGAELFIPSQNGRIDANGSALGTTVVQNINISTGVSQTVRAEIANMLPQIANAAKSAVADARQRGGGYSKALVGA